MDRADAAKLKEAGVKSLGAIEPLTNVKWVNLRGPSTDCLDLAELTRRAPRGGQPSTGRAACWE